jgi:N-sulfoglucosamine sulfohydrolase
MIMKLFVLLFCALLLIGCNKETTKQPNILVFIADDAGHLGSNEWLKTPDFDRIAAAGIQFTNSYTPNAKCVPSRVCLLTGRNSWQLKEAANHWNNFAAEFRTYPETLEDFGYFTGFTGKGWVE